MTICNYKEYIELAVTNLRDTNAFIKYNWLKLHNPNIDWQNHTLVFNRYSEEYSYVIKSHHADENVKGDLSLQDIIEEEDYLFFFDWNKYINHYLYQYINTFTYD